MRHDTRSAALHHQRRVARRRLTHQIGAPISKIKRISATPIIPGQSTILHERPTPTTTFRESPGLAGIACAALAFAPTASADPTAGHDTKVNTQTKRMLCEMGSDDADPGIGPNIVCQGSFVQAPAGDDQAFVTASGQFSYRSANIGVGYPHAPFDTLVPGQTYHIQAGRSWRAVTAFASPTTALGTACSSAAIPPSIRSDS